MERKEYEPRRILGMRWDKGDKTDEEFASWLNRIGMTQKEFIERVMTIPEESRTALITGGD